MTKNTTPPTHRIYAVTKNGKKGNYWQAIGALWPHADGEGFSVSLDYLPLNRDAEIVIRKPKAETEESGEAAGETA